MTVINLAFLLNILALLWLGDDVCLAFHITAMRAEQRAPLGISETMDLLYRYGYLHSTHDGENPRNPDTRPSFDPEEFTSDSALTRPPAQYHSAIRKFQRQYNLPVTGELDHTTAQLLTAPRCGNPDHVDNQTKTTDSRVPQTGQGTSGGMLEKVLQRVKRYVIGDERMKWTKKELTWQIRSYPTKRLSRVRTHAVMQYAFNLWSKHIDLDFVEEKDYYKPADIIIQFGAGKHGDSIPFDGPGGVLAHAHYPTPDNVYSLSGDAHFDDDETWNDGPHNEYRNLVSVAAHELGHSMGLGHSNVHTAIMYPYYLTTWSQVKLDQDDISGMQQIYGAAPKGKFLPPEPHLPDVPPPPPVSSPATDSGKIFDFCNISVDAIINIRNLDLYVFKNEWQWRITWSKTVTTWVSYQFRDGPAKITSYWPALPKHVDHIDAGIERYDGAIYIFRDKRFWLLADNVRLKPGVPLDGLPLSYLGFPDSVSHVDSVFRWKENNAIYVFVETYYWKLNEKEGQFGRVHGKPDYPRVIRDTWQGVPVPTKLAFTGLNGETLFFSGKDYYVFDNIIMSVRQGYPKPAALSILGCTQN